MRPAMPLSRGDCIDGWTEGWQNARDVASASRCVKPSRHSSWSWRMSQPLFCVTSADYPRRHKRARCYKCSTGSFGGPSHEGSAPPPSSSGVISGVSDGATNGDSSTTTDSGMRADGTASATDSSNAGDATAAGQDSSAMDSRAVDSGTVDSSATNDGSASTGDASDAASDTPAAPCPDVHGGAHRYHL